MTLRSADSVSCSRPPLQVLHLVRGPHGVGDHEVDDGVHLHRHVVARDDGLRLDLRDLLAQVDRGADRVEERHDRVEAGLGGAMVFAEPLDDLHLLLRDDLDRPQQHDQQEDREAEKDDAVHTRVTSSTMPSAATTRTFVPGGIGSGLRAAQSSPPTLTRPVPTVGSMSCVTMPSRPISGSVRDGTPAPAEVTDQARTQRRRARRPSRRRRCRPGRRHRSRDTAAAAAAMAPAPTNANPKCGIDTSTTAPMKAIASHASVSDLRCPRREYSDRMSVIIGPEQRASAGPAGPGHADEHQERRETEADQQSRLRFAAVVRLARQHTPDVGQRDGRKHRRGVFDRPESRDGSFMEAPK